MDVQISFDRKDARTLQREMDKGCGGTTSWAARNAALAKLRCELVQLFQQRMAELDRLLCQQLGHQLPPPAFDSPLSKGLDEAEIWGDEHEQLAR